MDSYVLKMLNLESHDVDALHEELTNLANLRTAKAASARKPKTKK